MRTIRAALALLVFAVVVSAQTVFLANYSRHPFSGWIRRAVDVKPPAASGLVDGVTWVRGRPRGLAMWDVDFRVTLRSGEVRKVDLASSTPVDADILLATPGVVASVWPMLAGTAMAVVSANPNGAGIDGHWRMRTGPMLCTDLWATVYPGQDWCTGELLTTASNPQVEDLFGVVPARFTLQGVDGVVKVAGLPQGSPLIPAGTTIASGQSWPPQHVTVLWGLEGAASAAAVSEQQVGCLTVTPWPQGTPLWWLDQDPTNWVSDWLARSRPYSQSWTAHPLGIAADARRTGGEMDQVYVAAALGHGASSVGGEWLAWMIGGSYMRRPSRHLEAGGESLRVDAHPDLCMWGGQPFAQGGSKDLLGKKGIPSLADTHGWWSWDEHDFHNWAYVGARMTGSLALQQWVEAQARRLLFEHTTDKRFSTTKRTGPCRSYGWYCLTTWWCWQLLDDRDLAEQIRDRWLWTWEQAALPRWGGQAFWDVRHLDPRLSGPTGRDDVWLAYQQAPMALWLDYCGEAFARPEARQLALLGAHAVLQHAYNVVDARQTGWHIVGVVDGAAEPLVNGDGALFGPGTESWMVTAPACVLRHQPKHEQARAIVEQAKRERPVEGRWVAPEVLQR